MAITRWTVTEPYLNTQCGLGEGPFYREHTNELRFVDIVGKQLHIVDLSQGPSSLRTISTGMSIGVTADLAGSDEVILAGAKDGITRFNVATATHEYVAKFWHAGDGPNRANAMRSNDGAVDSAGRFWVGTMNDPAVQEPAEPGVVFRLDTDGSVHRMVEPGPVIPNSISWNATDDTMFLTDTPANDILAFDFDAATGRISNRRVFFHHDDPSHLDGHVRDVEDCIWHACYGGAKVIRIAPDGRLIGEIALPTRNVTCPVFVGTALYVTSAKEDAPEKYPESAQFGGNVFRVDVGIRGRPRHQARCSGPV